MKGNAANTLMIVGVRFFGDKLLTSFVDLTFILVSLMV